MTEGILAPLVYVTSFTIGMRVAVRRRNFGRVVDIQTVKEIVTNKGWVVLENDVTFTATAHQYGELHLRDPWNDPGRKLYHTSVCVMPTTPAYEEELRRTKLLGELPDLRHKLEQNLSEQGIHRPGYLTLEELEGLLGVLKNANGLLELAWEERGRGQGIMRDGRTRAYYYKVDGRYACLNHPFQKLTSDLVISINGSMRHAKGKLCSFCQRPLEEVARARFVVEHEGHLQRRAYLVKQIETEADEWHRKSAEKMLAELDVTIKNYKVDP